mmetsp:Transcript_18359/g.37215  ORF Transcript_18359/g.37215 Transcript_18359/m.37215 type:complete len:220 (+) Transcript_18359:221-880(+)
MPPPKTVAAPAEPPTANSAWVLSALRVLPPASADETLTLVSFIRTPPSFTLVLTCVPKTLSMCSTSSRRSVLQTGSLTTSSDSEQAIMDSTNLSSMFFRSSLTWTVAPRDTSNVAISLCTRKSRDSANDVEAALWPFSDAQSLAALISLWAVKAPTPAPTIAAPFACAPAVMVAPADLMFSITRPVLDDDIQSTENSVLETSRTDTRFSSVCAMILSEL